MTADGRSTLLQDAHVKNQGAYKEMKNTFDSITRKARALRQPSCTGLKLDALEIHHKVQDDFG